MTQLFKGFYIFRCFSPRPSVTWACREGGVHRTAICRPAERCPDSPASGGAKDLVFLRTPLIFLLFSILFWFLYVLLWGKLLGLCPNLFIDF